MQTQPPTVAPPKEPGKMLPVLLLLIFGCCSFTVLPQAARSANQQRVDKAATAGAQTAAPAREANEATAEALMAAIALASSEAKATSLSDIGGDNATGGNTSDAAAPSPEVIYIVVTATPNPVTGASDSPARSNSPATLVIPTSSSAPAPGSAEFEELVAYARLVQPLLETGLRTAERDRLVLEGARDEPGKLCGGEGKAHPTLEADAAGMAELAKVLEAIDAPAPAASFVHRPLVESAKLWSKALGEINESCKIDAPIRQGLQRAGAAIQLGASLLQFGAAREGFERLFVSYGLGALIEGLQR
jgi:hypothetical protein